MQIEMKRSDDDILKISEVAKVLRCSRAHVSNLINGKVANVPPLPAIAFGRLKLVRWGTLKDWMRAAERGRDKLTTPETAPGRMAEGVYHA